MAIFYHVSTNLNHNGVFTPRVPLNRHQDEDEATPRICVAPSIEDCLTSIPNGGLRLERLNIDQRGYFLVFKIDTEKLKIQKSNIVESDVLFKQDLVRDAEVTNECWITESITVSKEDIYLIQLNNWSEEVEDLIPHYIYEIADQQYEGDYLEAYQDICDDFVPSITRIVRPIYGKENVEPGEEFVLHLGFDFDEEKEQLTEHILRNLNVCILNKDECHPEEIRLRANESMNLKGLFYDHAEMVGLLL